MTAILELQSANIAGHKSQSNLSPASTHSLCYKAEDSDRRHKQYKVVELKLISVVSYFLGV